MNSELTKDSRKTLKVIYDTYCSRRKSGQSKALASNFDAPECDGSSAINGFEDAKNELKAAGFITMDILGDFQLTDKAIIFMENFTKESILTWIEFGAKFIP